MNNLERLIEQYENGDCSPLIGTLRGSCDGCHARGMCLDFEGGCAESRARWLLAEYVEPVEPDSLERIQADAKKLFTDYWGCIDCCCQDCPAMVNGKTPDERFNVDSCYHAQSLDIHRRLSELDAF